MAFSKELIEQFRAAYKSQFGVMLTDEETIDELKGLAELVRLISPQGEA